MLYKNIRYTVYNPRNYKKGNFEYCVYSKLLPENYNGKFDSLVETANGMQFLNQAEAEQAAKNIIDDLLKGKF